MSDRLRPLEELTQMLLDAELAKLRQLSDDARHRQGEIARLGATVAARSAEVAVADGALDLAFETGQDARWQAWVAQTRRRLGREAAEVAARREAQRQKAQRAFGRTEALAGIRALEDEERRTRAARRLQVDPGCPGEPG